MPQYSQFQYKYVMDSFSGIIPIKVDLPCACIARYSKAVIFKVILSHINTSLLSGLFKMSNFLNVSDYLFCLAVENISCKTLVFYVLHHGLLYLPLNGLQGWGKKGSQNDLSPALSLPKPHRANCRTRRFHWQVTPTLNEEIIPVCESCLDNWKRKQSDNKG